MPKAEVAEPKEKSLRETAVKERLEKCNAALCECSKEIETLTGQVEQKQSEIQARMRAQVRGEGQYPEKDHRTDQEVLSRLQHELTRRQGIKNQALEFQREMEDERTEARILDLRDEAKEIKRKGIMAWLECEEAYSVFLQKCNAVRGIKAESENCYNRHGAMVRKRMEAGFPEVPGEIADLPINLNYHAAKLGEFKSLEEIRAYVLPGGKLPTV